MKAKDSALEVQPNVRATGSDLDFIRSLFRKQSTSLISTSLLQSMKETKSLKDSKYWHLEYS